MIRKCIINASSGRENARMHSGAPIDPRERIRELKVLRGFHSDRALALAAGLEQPTLARYLSGKTREMSVEHLRALAEALQVTLSELLGEVPLSSRTVLREAQSLLSTLDDSQVQQVISVTRALFPTNTSGPKT